MTPRWLRVWGAAKRDRMSWHHSSGLEPDAIRPAPRHSSRLAGMERDKAQVRQMSLHLYDQRPRHRSVQRDAEVSSAAAISFGSAPCHMRARQGGESGPSAVVRGEADYRLTCAAADGGTVRDALAGLEARQSGHV